MKLFAHLFVLLFFAFQSISLSAEEAKRISIPRTGLMPEDIAIIVNTADPLSVQIGRYYQQARRIPATQVIQVHFTPGGRTLSRQEFLPLKTLIDQKTPAHVQAYAVAWAHPYRVGCMSLTSALAFGFDPKYCSQRCTPTALSPYFHSASHFPANDLHLRPAMMLAGTSFDEAKALIDRGIAADHSFPQGQAYLLSTSDKARNSRAPFYPQTAQELEGIFPIQILETDFIADKKDILFYFTGLAKVPALDTLTFLPGAMADHLTSLGGMLTDSLQMSSLRWLEAGATASYGTVKEPCSYPQKFPAPALAMLHYATGASVIEAYWKSVAWPGEGVFIGEPLAKPFAPILKEISPGRFELKFFSLRSGQLRIEKSQSAAGPFKLLAQQPTQQGINIFHFRYNQKTQTYLRLNWN